MIFRSSGAALCAVALAAALAAQPAAAAKLLHVFADAHDTAGYGVDSGLTEDASGNLYGATTMGGASGQGTIFRLSPPASGQSQWTYTVLSEAAYGYGNGFPPSKLVLGAQGQLYGTTPLGGQYGDGTVFAVIPPASGQTGWTYQTIFAFNYSNGHLPIGLASDPSGALYGLTEDGGANCFTEGCGVVFKLTPPPSGQTAWTQTILYNFPGDGLQYPEPGLLRAPNGVLYGVLTYGQVFALSPPPAGQASWNEHTLYTFAAGNDYTNGFDPTGSLIIDNKGALYGTTYGGGDSVTCFSYAGCGVVFKLTPGVTPADPYTDTTLLTFHGGVTGANPYDAGVVMDRQGNLLGTTQNGGAACADGSQGVVYELSPPPAGASEWTESLPPLSTCNFGGFPQGPLVLGGNGVVFGATNYNGPLGGGTVFMGGYRPNN